MAQNIGRITIPERRILGALEQGNFGSHQGIELGNQLLSGKALSLALVGIFLKENELWLVIKALGPRSDAFCWCGSRDAADAGDMRPRDRHRSRLVLRISLQSSLGVCV